MQTGEIHIKYTPYMYRHNVYHIQHNTQYRECVKERRENRHEKIWYKVGIIMKVLSSCTLCHTIRAFGSLTRFYICCCCCWWIRLFFCFFFQFVSCVRCFMCTFGPRQKPEGTNLYPNTINSGSADGSKSARFSCSINSYIGEWFNYHYIYIYIYVRVLWMYW